MTKLISRFHYLTQDIPDISHAELAETACKNGIRWIQLRVKMKPFDEWLKIAKGVKDICDQYHSILIINDNVQIAREIEADGVHLGENDMPVAEARKILGDKIIGGTANTKEDILRLIAAGADYIGVGPFRFTSTKENLKPLLGIKGYSKLIDEINSHIPLIAIGGITIDDAAALIKTGVSGIAVSSAINITQDREKAIAAFLIAVA